MAASFWGLLFSLFTARKNLHPESFDAMAVSNRIAQDHQIDSPLADQLDAEPQPYDDRIVKIVQADVMPVTKTFRPCCKMAQLLVAIRAMLKTASVQC